MDLYREENIRRILNALDADEYDDAKQDEAVGTVNDVPEETAHLLDLYVMGPKVLEIGCGSGNSFGRWPITHAVEPCLKRCEKAVERGKKSGVVVRRAVAECLPFDGTTRFQTVLMMNGFFQVRSDYEALIEINRVLLPRGRFIFNLQTNDNMDIVCGRVLGWRNHVRLCGQFGFELLAVHSHNFGPRYVPPEQITTVLVMEKVRDFDPRYLSLPQVIGDPKSVIRNYIPERDHWLC